MRIKTPALAVTAVVLILQGVNANAQNSPVDEHQKILLTEVLQLRADLLQFLISTQQSTVQALKHDMDRLKLQERRLEESETGRNQQLAAIEKQLASVDLEASARPQIEAIRQQLYGEAAEKLRLDRLALHQRQADLKTQIDTELQRLQTLKWQAEKVQNALSR
jgi:hypothetical protein